MQDVNTTDQNGTSRCQFSKYAVPDYTIYLQFYNLFMLFWLVNFVIALGQMTLAGAFASYYWAFTKPQDIPHLPVYQSLRRSLRYCNICVMFDFDNMVTSLHFVVECYNMNRKQNITGLCHTPSSSYL